jgi:hypothetical protein
MRKQPTTKEKIQRLKQALRVMTSMSAHVRKHHFDMSYWGQKTSCGTVACLAGHCGLDPWFRRKGFKMDFKEDRNEEWEGNTQIISVEFRDTFPEADPAQFFGDDIEDQIFTRMGSYVEVKKRVVAAIKQLEAGQELDVWHI